MTLEIEKISPTSICEELEKVVIGQHQAAMTLATVFYIHLIKSNQQEYGRKYNLMLIGASGSGKTYLVQNLAKLFPEFNLVQLDATQLSREGYKGSSAKELISKALYGKPNQGTSIIYIDEIDKVTGNTSADLANWNRDLQASLLKLIEGVDLGGYTTQNMLFVLSGNFQSVRDKRKEPNKRTSIGFTDITTGKEKGNTIHDELIEAGMTQELVGRIGYVGELNSLTKEDFRKILMHDQGVMNDLNKTFYGKDEKQYLKLKGNQVEDLLEQAEKAEVGARVLAAGCLKLWADRFASFKGMEQPERLAEIKKKREDSQVEELVKALRIKGVDVNVLDLDKYKYLPYPYKSQMSLRQDIDYYITQYDENHQDNYLQLEYMKYALVNLLELYGLHKSQK